MERLGFISYIDAYTKDPNYTDPPDYTTTDIERDLQSIGNQIPEFKPNRNILIGAGVVTIALLLSSKV